MYITSHRWTEFIYGHKFIKKTDMRQTFIYSRIVVYGMSTGDAHFYRNGVDFHRMYERHKI